MDKNINNAIEHDGGDANDSSGDDLPFERKYKIRMLNNVVGGYVSDSSADEENEDETETFGKWVSNKRNADGTLKMVKKPKDALDVQWNECVYHLKSYNRSKAWFDNKERKLLAQKHQEAKAKEQNDMYPPDVTEQFEMDIESDEDDILQFQMEVDEEAVDYHQHWMDVNDMNFLQPPSPPEPEENELNETEEETN